MTERYKLHHNHKFGYGVEDTLNPDKEYFDGFEQLVDLLNILSTKCSHLEKENEKLKKDRFICLDCEYMGYTEIGCLCEHDDCWIEGINECEDFKECKE